MKRMTCSESHLTVFILKNTNRIPTVYIVTMTLQKDAYLNILKFLPQKKNESFQVKNSDIFHISAQNIETNEAVLMSIHNLCF